MFATDSHYWWGGPIVHHVHALFRWLEATDLLFHCHLFFGEVKCCFFIVYPMQQSCFFRHGATLSIRITQFNSIHLTKERTWSFWRSLHCIVPAPSILILYCFSAVCTDCVEKDGVSCNSANLGLFPADKFSPVVSSTVEGQWTGVYSV